MILPAKIAIVIRKTPNPCLRMIASPAMKAETISWKLRPGWIRIPTIHPIMERSWIVSFATICIKNQKTSVSNATIPNTQFHNDF